MKVNGPLDATLNIRQGKEQLSVLQFNVLNTNTSYNQTLERIKELNADLISFQEVSKVWSEELESSLKGLYPYYKIVTDAGQGIAIFSKNQLIDLNVLNWKGTQNITGKIRVKTEEINFFTLHTRSPTTKAKICQ